MKIDRLIGILALLLQKGPTTAPELARRFEVSRRTINRDVEHLCRAGIPLVTTQGYGGGIALMEGYRLDSALLTNPELRAILAGLRGLDSVSPRYRQLMERLAPQNSSLLTDTSHIFIDLSSWYHDSLAPKIELLQQAIEQKRLVAFDYCGPGGESARRAEPYLLLFQWSAWYLWGYCRAKEDWRMFKLSRVQSLALTEEGFSPRELPPVDFSPTRFITDEIPVAALVEPEQKWRLIEEFGPDCCAPLPDGRLRFTHGFTRQENLISWVFSFGGGLELVEPAALREEIRRRARQIAALHGDGKN